MNKNPFSFAKAWLGIFKRNFNKEIKILKVKKQRHSHAHISHVIQILREKKAQTKIGFVDAALQCFARRFELNYA